MKTARRNAPERAKCVLVTGGAGGMGLAVCRKFASEGFRVFALDVSDAPSIENVTFIKADLTDMDAVANAFEYISRKTSALDCIINMAGVYDLDSLVEMDESAFLRIFDINLFAAYRVNKTFLPLLVPGGRVIVTSSELAPLDPLPFTGIYAITKAAVEKYAYSLRMELQLLGYKVSVIRPGAVDTGLLDVSVKRLNDFTENSRLYKTQSERFKRIVNRVEARKVSPERIAGTAFKAAVSPHPAYVYKLNRNPFLLILNALPDRMQNAVIKAILKPKKQL